MIKSNIDRKIYNYIFSIKDRAESMDLQYIYNYNGNIDVSS